MKVKLSSMENQLDPKQWQTVMKKKATTETSRMEDENEN